MFSRVFLLQLFRFISKHVLWSALSLCVSDQITANFMSLDFYIKPISSFSSFKWKCEVKNFPWRNQNKPTRRNVRQSSTEFFFFFLIINEWEDERKNSTIQIQQVYLFTSGVDDNDDLSWLIIKLKLKQHKDTNWSEMNSDLLIHRLPSWWWSVGVKYNKTSSNDN